MLAHELRNPLAPISNATRILKMRGPAKAVEQSRKSLGATDAN